MLVIALYDVHFGRLSLIDETGESYDLEIFNLITSEMIDENINKIDLEHIKRIDSLLSFFEMEHRNHTTRKGKPIIKDEYIEKRYLRRLK